MHYPEFLPIKKTVKTDIASYHVEVWINTEEHGVEVSIYEPEKTGFFFVKYRKLLANKWFPLHTDVSIDECIAELLRDYERPFRLIRQFEEWNGYLDLSKEPEEEEETPQVINKVNINGKDIVGAIFDNLTQLVKSKEHVIPVYDWKAPNYKYYDYAEENDGEDE